MLSLPTAAETGAITAAGTVTTDEAKGILHYLATENVTETAATIKAGSSERVSGSGVQNVSFTGLTAETLYYAHYVHDDPSSNESNVVSSPSFTTEAPLSGHFINLTSKLNAPLSSALVSGLNEG